MGNPATSSCSDLSQHLRPTLSGCVNHMEKTARCEVCRLSRLRSLNNCGRTLYKGIQNQNLPVQAPSSLTKTARDRWASAGRNASNATLSGYLSKREKLYNEVDRGRRGRKVAEPNLAVQVGLTHTPMANTGLQTLLQSCQPQDVKKSTWWLQKEYFAIKKSTFHFHHYLLAIHL